MLRAEKALSVTQTGIVMGLWGAAPILGAPLLGMLSDRVGRKAMIVWTGYPSALTAFVLFYWLKSPGALTLGASILGLLITAFPTLVIALAQDSTRPEAADTASGIIMATHYVAAVLAPLATAQLLATTGNMVWTMVAATAGPLVLYASLVAAVGEKPMRVPGPSPTV